MSLTTLDAVKAHLFTDPSVTPPVTHDALLSGLITRASAFVEGWLNRNILSATYTATVDGPGGTVLTLPNYPITAVSAVTVDGTAIPASTGATISGYVFDANAVKLRGYTFAAGILNVSISYTAGYATVPGDVEQAVIDIVCRKYRGLERIGLVSKGMAGETTTYAQSDMSADTKSLLNQYRRVIPA